MAIEALYPSRRYPQRDNPLFRRERRQGRLMIAFAIIFCALAMAVFRISPNEAAAEGRPTAAPRTVAAVSEPAPHIRVIPLYKIPPEQAGGLFP
ncbi:MAG: hypothetical protein ACLQL2_11345 [Methylovirgula sp.]